ncbi:uncharacterized protein LOC120344333 [Styela clava]
MIIEAAPRLVVEPLESYPSPPHRLKFEKTQITRDNREQSKPYQKLFATRNNCRSTISGNSEDLLNCDRGNKSRKCSHRTHPYDCSAQGKRAHIKWNYFLNNLPFHDKCPLLLPDFRIQKSLYRLSTSNKRKVPRSKTLDRQFTPIFTANANENNDNSPSATYCCNQLTESQTVDAICDAEIEDLTTEHTTTYSTEETTFVRQRRTSLNTNPLSSITTRTNPHDPLSLSQSDDLNLRYSSTSGIKEARRDKSENFYQFIRQNISSSPGLSSNDKLPGKYNTAVERETSSIERLVDFFESNSSNRIFRPRIPSDQRQNKESYLNFTKTHSSNQREPRESPNFPHLFRNSWDYFIKNSTDYQQSSVPVGGIYNNNGNAASAPPESKFIWPGIQYGSDNFSSAGQHESIRKTTSSSPVFFPSNRIRCGSSLARVSPDVELIDLESTRFPVWHSVHIAFDKRQLSKELSSNSLIDLQSSSNQTVYDPNKWLRHKRYNSGSKKATRSQDGNCFTEGFNRIDKVKEGFESNFCRIRSQEGKPFRLSENNHHNSQTDWHSFDRVEKSYPDRIQEPNFPFNNFNLHQTLLNPCLSKSSVFLQTDSNEMGCIQSIAKAKVSPDRCHYHGVIVEDIQAAIDRTPTEIEEKSPIVLRYRTPYFRASAHVIVPPIPRKETWTVGWIQACDAMKFINQYGNLGNSSWEIPALKDRRITAVSDSDGVSYPWYGNTTEIATVEGPTDTSRSLTLRMNDNFYPSVTWDIPVSEGSEAHLTHIVRDQSFTTWLAAVNQTTGRLEVLRTVKWHFYLEIDVDPTQELGKRARIVSPLVQKQPIILKNNTEPIYISSPRRSSSNGSATSGRTKRLNRRPGAGGDNNSNNHTNYIPKSALVRPSANNAQTLIWRPTRDVPVIVVPAKEEYKENNEVVWFTRTPTMHGHDHNVRILSTQEMTQLKKSIS